MTREMVINKIREGVNVIEVYSDNMQYRIQYHVQKNNKWSVEYTDLFFDTICHTCGKLKTASGKCSCDSRYEFISCDELINRIENHNNIYFLKYIL